MKLIITLLILLCLLYMIAYKKINPFVAMIVVSIIAGVVLGLPLSSIMDSFESGVGDILGSLSLILGLGAMIAQIMDESGAIRRLSHFLLKKLGSQYIQIATLIVGVLIGFALFFDAGFILFIPIVLTLSKQMNVNSLFLGIPAAASLLTVHTFFPPHPGAVEIIKTLHVNEGKLLLIGLIVTAISVIVSGLWWSRRCCGNQQIDRRGIESTSVDNNIKWTIFILVLPVVLIAMGSFIPMVNHNTLINSFIKLIGNPVVALLITLLMAIYLYGYRNHKTTSEISDILGQGVQTISLVLLINGAGGGMKQILMDAGVTKEVTNILMHFHLPMLWMGFIIAAIMRVMLGSSTISAITASSMIATLPMPGGMENILVALAIGAGSMFGSHINDPGFWLFKQYFQLSVVDTFKTWTMMTIIGSLTSMTVLTVLSAIF